MRFTTDPDMGSVFVDFETLEEIDEAVGFLNKLPDDDRDKGTADGLVTTFTRLRETLSAEGGEYELGSDEARTLCAALETAGDAAAYDRAMRLLDAMNEAEAGVEDDDDE